jgi:hypothetical protein
LKPFKIIQPWVKYLKAFFVLFSVMIQAQNSITSEINANDIMEININGNQIFNITVTTSSTEFIKISSLVDGEYQDYFQVITVQKDGILFLKLEKSPLSVIADDKRNAHKVVAVNLSIEMPDNLNLNIKSDIGYVDVEGDFNSLSIELIRGNCKVIGSAEQAMVNTIDGHINIETKNAKVNAVSNNGTVIIDDFKFTELLLTLQSINGNITVRNQE